MAIINGSLTISGTSTLAASSKVIFAGKFSINNKSNTSIFWLNLKSSGQINLNSSSRFEIETSIRQRLSSIVISGASSIKAEIVKAGKAFFRKSSIIGEVITKSLLEGGGFEFMKTNQDFKLVSGDYHELNIKIYDEEGNPKDISGSTFTWTLGNISKTNGNGISITDPLNGEITIVLTPDDTINLNGKYPHQARMIDAHNHPTTILKGIAVIQK